MGGGSFENILREHEGGPISVGEKGALSEEYLGAFVSLGNTMIT